MSNGVTSDTSSTVLRKRVGHNIRLARNSRDLTQSELAAAIGVNSGQIVSDWERGVALPSTANAAALAQELGRDIAWFYTDHDEEPIAA